MRGSDLDLMVVLNAIEVWEDTDIHFNADKIYFESEMEDTQLRYTKLRLMHSYNREILKECEKIGSDFYLSNHLKERFTNDCVST